MEGVTVKDSKVVYSKTEWLPDGGPRGSITMGAEVTVSLAEGVAFASVHDKLQAGLQAEVDKAMDVKIKALWQAIPQAPAHQAPRPTQAPAAPAPAPQAPTQAPQAGGNGAGSEVWVTPTIRHEVTPSGVHILRVRPQAGTSRWTKHGAPMWPEAVKEQIGAGWLEAQPFGADLPLPEGKTQVVVTLKADGKPDRVARFE